jgi:hypothetical protein
MHMKGFDPKRCDWIMNFVQSGSAGIRVNVDIGHYFKLEKDYRKETHYL